MRSSMTEQSLTEQSLTKQGSQGDITRLKMVRATRASAHAVSYACDRFTGSG
jgi:hypothetical protein